MPHIRRWARRLWREIRLGGMSIVKGSVDFYSSEDLTFAASIPARSRACQAVPAEIVRHAAVSGIGKGCIGVMGVRGVMRRSCLSRRPPPVAVHSS